jgi:hypothetical protein
VSVTSTHLGHGSASSTREGVTKVGAVAIDKRLTRIGVVEVLTLSSGALGVGKVGNEHVRKRAKSRGGVGSGSGGTSAANLNRSAVHVELAVSDLVQPRPGESVLTIGHVLGHCDGEGSGSVASRVLLEIACNVGRAAANNAVDDLPLRRLCGLGVCGHGELARAATVNCRTDERDALGLTSIPLVHLGDIVNTRALLARVVAGSEGRAVDGIVAVRNGVLEDHVCGSAGSKCQKGCSLAEHLVVCARECEVFGYFWKSLDLLNDSFGVCSDCVV